MKKIFVFAAVCFSVIFSMHAQELSESLEIIESSVKDSMYYNFTISGDGYLSYNWGDNYDNATTVTINLSNVTISKDYTSFSPKLWINCIDNNSCISEQGRIGSMDGMYFNYSRTYLPAKNDNDLDAMFIHMSYLMQYATVR